MLAHFGLRIPGPLAIHTGRRYDATVILAGDVGGTKTHLALYPPGAAPRRPAFDRLYASHEHPALDALVAAFLVEAGGKGIERAVLGIAGVVVGNRCETTNLPWHVDGASIAHLLGGADVTLINDLAATAYGLDQLVESDLDTLQPGSAPELAERAHGSRAVIAAGTGLGMVATLREGAHTVVASSEGGHADFAPRTDDEIALHGWLRSRYGRVSAERVLSGRGLADIHRFLGERKRGAESAEFAARFAAAEDPAAVVTAGALDGSCERAMLALRVFVEAYGGEAGNLALRALPIEGLFLGGGIAPRIRSAFRDGGFLSAFNDKPPMTELLERIPVHLILETQTALWGAAVLALAGD